MKLKIGDLVITDNGSVMKGGLPFIVDGTLEPIKEGQKWRYLVGGQWELEDHLVKVDLAKLKKLIQERGDVF